MINDFTYGYGQLMWESKIQGCQNIPGFNIKYTLADYKMFKTLLMILIFVGDRNGKN